MTWSQLYLTLSLLSPSLSFFHFPCSLPFYISHLSLSLWLLQQIVQRLKSKGKAIALHTYTHTHLHTLTGSSAVCCCFQRPEGVLGAEIMSSSVQPGGGVGNTHTHTHNFSFAFFLSHTETQRQLPRSILGRIFHLSPADFTVTHCKDYGLLKRLLPSPRPPCLFPFLLQRNLCSFKRGVPAPVHMCQCANVWHCDCLLRCTNVCACVSVLCACWDLLLCSTHIEISSCICVYDFKFLGGRSVVHVHVWMHAYSYESEDDDEEEQEAVDGMFSSAACSKPWFVCLKWGLSFEWTAWTQS